MLQPIALQNEVINEVNIRMMERQLPVFDKQRISIVS